ncbi:MAG: hypothetical protein Q8K32_13765 [Archangium sp.]|nr:hypothetical protein [Archangium sp.]
MTARSPTWLFVSSVLLLGACQCVLLPAELRCTASSCAPGETCGDDGRCAVRVGDAGCTPLTDCVTAGRECGLLETGCGEVACGECSMGTTCGAVVRGRCAPCDPAAADLPDPDFVDSNCDGLDGTIDGGLFVDPESGSDLNPGTLSRPLYSLAQAAVVIEANPGFHTVFISQGTTEGLTWRSPVSLAGGYRTPEWSRSRSLVSRVRARGTGLRLEKLPSSVSISQLTIESTPGDAGTASIGLMVFESPVTLQQLVVLAGDGPPGLRGSDGVRGANGGAGGAGVIGTSGQLCDAGCSESPVEGRGGDGGVGPCGEGRPGLASELSTVDEVSSLDGVLLRPEGAGCGECPCVSGRGNFESLLGLDAPPVSSVPAPGDAGLDGLPGPRGAGGLDGGQWLPLVGVSGGAGAPGRPGEGGSAGGRAVYGLNLDDGGQSLLSVVLGSSGGGGGAPGCGGSAGGGGVQGGASIGLVIFGASPRLQDVGVIAGLGGAGGAPGLGGEGGSGGAGGAGGPRLNAACEPAPILSRFGLSWPGAPSGSDSFFSGGAGGTGGMGGVGGRGGAGSAGAPGPSVGVWCERSTVSLAQVQVLVSPARDGGVSVVSLDCQ